MGFAWPGVLEFSMGRFYSRLWRSSWVDHPETGKIVVEWVMERRNAGVLSIAQFTIRP